ncbi:hypothetical protein [Helicobacter anatolicus]|uniref:hypothetical protein n=1 Tax=Helicobacter anatolicus TaxID=2905874 RepID=UPI001E42AA6A|nr:hypothetical protein [Helicobacter anatolicus]MCE3038053.1 hypothetical protein [Helicobacter anatolicus]
MKKYLILFLISCLCLEAANTRYARKSSVRKTRQHQQQVPFPSIILSGSAGLGIDYYHYEEPKVMNIHGPMINFYGDFGITKKLFKFQLDGYFATHFGANKYNGALQSHETQTRTPYNAKSTDWYVGVSTKFGLNLWQHNKELIFAYLGLGYRFLHNFVIDNPGVQASYFRNQGYLYLPIGIDGEIPINPKISLVGEFEYRFFLLGHNTSGFSDLGYDKDLYFIQKEGYGIRIGFGSKFYFDNGGALRVKVHYEYWGVENSNIVTATQNGVAKGNYVEPKNFTRSFGVSIAYVF